MHASASMRRMVGLLSLGEARSGILLALAEFDRGRAAELHKGGRKRMKLMGVLDGSRVSVPTRIVAVIKYAPSS